MQIQSLAKGLFVNVHIITVHIRCTYSIWVNMSSSIHKELNDILGKVKVRSKYFRTLIL